jgi:hypothetical protein
MKAYSTFEEWTHSTKDPKNGLSGSEHSRFAVVQSTIANLVQELERIAQLIGQYAYFLIISRNTINTFRAYLSLKSVILVNAI